MRKFIIPAVSCVLALSMTGCAATKVGRIQPDNKPTDNAQETTVADEVKSLKLNDYVPLVEADALGGANLYDFDFVKLQSTLEQLLPAKDNQISIPFMYDLPAVYIQFQPSGVITKWEMSLRALTDENENEYIVSRYTVKGNTGGEAEIDECPDGLSHNPETGAWILSDESGESDAPIVGLNVQTGIKNQRYAKTGFQDTFLFDEFPELMTWMSETDFKDLINTCVPGDTNMCWYEFIAGAELPRNVLDDPETTCTFWDCSSGTPVQVKLEDLPYSDPEIYYFEPAYDYDGPNHKQLRYYMLIPYYSDDKGQNDTPNNIAILLPDGIAK